MLGYTMKFMHKKASKRFVKGIRNLLVSSIGLIFLVSGCLTISPRRDAFVWPDALISHSVIESDDMLEQLWSRSNVFTRNENIGTLVAAINEIVFILGSIEPTEEESVLALSALDGTPLWHSTPGIRTALYATSSALYVGYGGSGLITAYDLHTGQILWSEHASGARDASYLYVFDQIIHLNSSNHLFHLMKADTGEIIQTLKYVDGHDIFISTDEITFIQQPTEASLQAIETQSGKLIWEANVQQEYIRPPVFTEEIIFIRTGRGLGSVYAINRQTGNILWHTERNVVSNVAATKSTVFLLTLDGKLLGFDQQGKLITSVRFNPGPFILNGPDAQVGGYYVAIDRDAQMLFVFLGDSNQLFAFRLGKLD